jgi:hypothetical protein
MLVPYEQLPATEYGQSARGKVPTLESTYPLISRWLARSGSIEIGRTGKTDAMARALDNGEPAWIGRDSYGTLDEIMRDMNEGLKQWFRDHN